MLAAQALHTPQALPGAHRSDIPVYDGQRQERAATPRKSCAAHPLATLHKGEIVMASLPHTSASREPLPTLVAELYGDPSTPTAPLPADRCTTDERWQDAVTQVAEQLRTTLRVEVLPDRLHKALALVLIHAVTLHPDGTASVQSGTQTYTLAPECPCA